MGALIGFAVLGIPCAAFLVWCLTPKGKKWLKANNMIQIMLIKKSWLTPPLFLLYTLLFVVLMPRGFREAADDRGYSVFRCVFPIVIMLLHVNIGTIGKRKAPFLRGF